MIRPGSTNHRRLVLNLASRRRKEEKVHIFSQVARGAGETEREIYFRYIPHAASKPVVFP